ncbi:hypothetical protein SSX86_029935 [Deinandra increscens subsp. villosa]|uniref:Uncharacterized protein n=1 Tax=Deinandra increscens subsp. villosa TaxID=3103831 RepID=A0AAP0CGM4_9ASTR
MRKLYNHNKGKIHPSPPPTTAAGDHLPFLPLAIATLAAALAPEDKEVLSYLLSCSITTANVDKNFAGNTRTTAGGGGTHPPKFNCYCFSCYTSYWVRWDSSPNRQLIHEIIDAYEDGLIKTNKKSGKNKKERKKNKGLPSSTSPHAPLSTAEIVPHAPPHVEENMISNDDEDESIIATSSEKGSVRKFVNFIGERIWGVWGI